MQFEPGRAMTFRVEAGPFKVAEWSYAVEPSDDGCRVTESWTDSRSGLMKTLSKPVTGVDDRPSHNRQGMEKTLGRLAAAVEGTDAD
jgi:hypothetical protein